MLEYFALKVKYTEIQAYTAYMVLFFGLPIRLYLPLENLVKVQSSPL